MNTALMRVSFVNCAQERPQTETVAAETKSIVDTVRARSATESALERISHAESCERVYVRSTSFMRESVEECWGN